MKIMCATCHKKYDDCLSLDRHQRNTDHSGFRYPSHKCNSKIVSTSIKKKISPIYSSYPFECKECFKQFKTEKSLIQHVNSKKHQQNSISNRECCEICGMFCLGKTALTKHKNRVHSNPLPLKKLNQNIKNVFSPMNRKDRKSPSQNRFHQGSIVVYKAKKSKGVQSSSRSIVVDPKCTVHQYTWENISDDHTYERCIKCGKTRMENENHG